jgi:hypothetical protein
VPYVFDTSALIGAWVRTYPPDVMPGLWENLDNLAQRGEMHAPEEVLAELKRQDDDLAAWVKARSDQIVVATTRALMLEARDILRDHAGLTMTGTGRGLADPFVIALAALKECPVVTHEQGGSAAKPRIPYVCGQRQVGCMNMLGVIRAERWQFR